MTNGAAHRILILGAQEDSHAHRPHRPLGHLKVEDLAVKRLRTLEVGDGNLVPVHRILDHFHGTGS
jgi:hypothetical protein